MSEFNPFSLKDKTILVTGASSGIGRGIAVACSKMGAHVVATGRNSNKLDQTKDEMAESGNVVVTADLLCMDDLKSLSAGVPKLDGVVHCAGIGLRMPAKMVQDEDIDRVLNTNFKASVLLQTELMRCKKLNRSSSVVFIASAAAHMPTPGNSIYSASKAALIGYAKCLALELASREIRVNCICPAMIWTDLIMQEGAGREELEHAQLKYPLKRYGTPEDVSYLAVYLLSDASKWMTNNCIDITGGTNEL